MKLKFTVPYILTGLAVLIGTGRASNNNARAAVTEYTSITQNYIPSFFSTKAKRYITHTTTPYPISVEDQKHTLLYICNTGDTICRTGGSRAWRNFNPGCIVYGKFARDNGAIGKGGKFAVFPDEETGRNALIALLRGDKYNNLTIDRAVMKYAPPKENNVKSYKRKLCAITGLSLNTKLCDLTDEQIERVADAITKIEGWTPGTETTLAAAPQQKSTPVTDLAMAQTKIAQFKMQQKQRTL